MPTYQYLCTACGHAFEQVQRFSDDALTVCPECDGRLRKVFNSVGVVFKGSGFYKTDSRSSSSSTETSSTPSSSPAPAASTSSDSSSSAAKTSGGSTAGSTSGSSSTGSAASSA